MAVLRRFEQADLSITQALCFGCTGCRRVLVEPCHQVGRGLVADVPERGEGTFHTGLNGDTGKTQRGSIITCCSLASAEHKQIQGELRDRPAQISVRPSSANRWMSK